MPELPEVETIRRSLLPLLPGRRILSVAVRRADIVGFPRSGRAFVSTVRGRRITGLGRRGKYLVLQLERGKELVIHLRLSGHLEVSRNGARPKYERLRLGLSGGAALSFVEPRVLGRVYAMSAGSYPAQLTGMMRMGPEPIAREFTPSFLAGKLKGRRASVKSMLLDQRVCCGVGNIYSDEALFRARVRPLREAGSLSRADVARLAQGLKAVLRDGIRWCGTTLGDGRYLRPDGAAGGFQKRLRVFGREGQGCRRCGTRIVVARAGGRRTRYCPRCQR